MYAPIVVESDSEAGSESKASSEADDAEYPEEARYDVSLVTVTTLLLLFG